MNTEMIVKLRKMGTHISILYVEDDRAVAEQFENLFRKVFKNLDVVYDGKAGLTKYKELKHDIVITDIEMPNMNGIELIQAIRKINHDQLIIVTSAYNDAKNLQKLIENEVDKFILKPFDMGKLFRDVAKIVSITYNKKRSEHLKKQLKEKVKLNQLLLDKMPTPLVVINEKQILYKNEKFDELFELRCDIGREKCSLSTVFKSEKLSKLNHKELLEYIELHTNEKHINLKNRRVERFKIETSHLEGTHSTLVSFTNTEAISREIDRLRNEAKLDALTHLSTREIFIKQLDDVLDGRESYSVLCFGLKNIKEFVRIFGVGQIHDVYETLGRNLRRYFQEDIAHNRLSLYYFDTNHFVLLTSTKESEKVKEMLHDFGETHRYSTLNVEKYEPMSLDFLAVELDKKASAQKNITEIENQLYMLKGEN